MASICNSTMTNSDSESEAKWCVVHLPRSTDISSCLTLSPPWSMTQHFRTPNNVYTGDTQFTFWNSGLARAKRWCRNLIMQHISELVTASFQLHSCFSKLCKSNQEFKMSARGRPCQAAYLKFMKTDFQSITIGQDRRQQETR